MVYEEEQIIGQLEARKGGYFYLKIDADVVNQYEQKRKTRFICRLDDQIEFCCGLSHLGDGNFFIILSKKNLDLVDKELGDRIHFQLREDPDPLGVDMPETFLVLLEQDEALKEIFYGLTLGKKRNVIHQMIRIKSIDKQINKAISLLQASQHN